MSSHAGEIPAIRTFITGKYPSDLLKQCNYVVAESESFIVITGISPYRTFLFDCYSRPKDAKFCVTFRYMKSSKGFST